MCGIFALLNIQNSSQEIEDNFKKGWKRGPEHSVLTYDYDKIALGFHRLAINGLNSASNQPIIHNNIVLICNGEIYNYVSLYKSIDVVPNTDSDCEVIIHLYLKYGIEQTLIMLDGVFAFILIDNTNNNIYVARDPLGIRPLYKMKNSYLYGFASELKTLEHFYNKNNNSRWVEQFEPGTYSMYSKENTIWSPILEHKKYFLFPVPSTLTEEGLISNIGFLLKHAVEKRCSTTERPVACLLSGGLDSSLIASIVSNYFDHFENKQIETYSIGLENSEDIKYAKKVADYIKSKHTEIIITEKEMFEAIPEVIEAIESYDTTTVRASIGNYLLGKYISTHSEAKVIFNGDGSDELFGGYLYMNKCKDDIEFDKETRRLLNDIYMYDVLRSDKSISSNGLEPRTPFLDRTLVSYVLSLPPNVRNHNNYENGMEKRLLRYVVDKNMLTYKDGLQFLPNEILYRRKEAFSDGVSSKGRSLYVILQEYIAEYYNKKENTNEYHPTIELERRYYKELFDKYFPNCEHILPYFWMPRYTNAKDPSARTLDIYNT